MKSLACFCVAFILSSHSYSLDHKYFENYFKTPSLQNSEMITDYCSLEKILESASSRPIREEAQEIKTYLQRNMTFQQRPTDDQLATALASSRCLLNNKRRFKKKSVFTPPTRELFPFYLQVFKTGEVYFHFETLDAKLAQGGYKRFSRSYSVTDKAIKAHLVLDMNAKKDWDKIAREIDALDHFKGHEQIAQLNQYDIYATIRPKKDAKSELAPGKSNFLSMITDLYDGDTKELSQKRITLKQKIEIMIQMTSSLRAFHEAGYLHRDIKRQNYFYKTVGGRTKVVLADFGLAEHRTRRDLGHSICGTKAFIDTRHCVLYMDKKPMFTSFQDGIKSDIFSLAITFEQFFNNFSEMIKVLNVDVRDKGRRSKDAILSTQMTVNQYHAATFPNKPFLWLLRLVWEMASPDPSIRHDLEYIETYLNKILEEFDSAASES